MSRRSDTAERAQITHEELVAEIERIDKEHSDGASVTELAAKTGRSRETILARLKTAAAEGRLVVGRKRVFSIDGRPTMVPCYKVLRRKRAWNP